MKKVLIFLGLVVGIPVVVGACFLGFAMTVDEFTYATSVQVERPPAEVWAVFQDEEKLPDWLDGLASVELVSGEALQPGAVWKLHFDVNGNAFDMTETVTACTPPSLHAFDMDNDYFLGHTEIRLNAVDGGTEIATTNRVVGKNAFLRGFLYIQRGTLQEQAQASYVKLKQLVESPGA